MTEQKRAVVLTAASGKWRVFAVAAGGTLMATIDASTVSVALPKIGEAFRAPLTSVEWVAVAYLVTATGLLLTFGRLADMRGRRGIYLAGLVIFTLGSGLCATAQGFAPLIAFRILQAVGGAMIAANTAALITEAFPPNERGRALGLSSAVVSAGLMLGPTLGGLLIGSFSWRAVFLANLPMRTPKARGGGKRRSSRAIGANADAQFGL